MFRLEVPRMRKIDTSTVSVAVHGQWRHDGIIEIIDFPGRAAGLWVIVSPLWR